MTYLEQQNTAFQLLLVEIETCELEYADNFRVALKGDAYDEAAYQAISDGGCCGYFDKVITVDGVKWKIGCNYGH